jgi:transcriptional regulator with XRE-family HTH domain
MPEPDSRVSQEDAVLAWDRYRKADTGATIEVKDIFEAFRKFVRREMDQTPLLDQIRGANEEQERLLGRIFHRGTLSKWENGIQSIGKKTRDKILTALGMTRKTLPRPHRYQIFDNASIKTLRWIAASRTPPNTAPRWTLDKSTFGILWLTVNTLKPLHETEGVSLLKLYPSLVQRGVLQFPGANIRTVADLHLFLEEWAEPNSLYSCMISKYKREIRELFDEIS